MQAIFAIWVTTLSVSDCKRSVKTLKMCQMRTIRSNLTIRIILMVRPPLFPTRATACPRGHAEDQLHPIEAYDDNVQKEPRPDISPGHLRGSHLDETIVGQVPRQERNGKSKVQKGLEYQAITSSSKDSGGSNI
eukprot:SRR837773.24978.p1 GENE.SRR837773.24978~~SRR837773.24978.p1  ORF type:complete len:134 (+),score=16.66 SRR837773.24978:46-447(+)